ncbi:MAG: hypothetical protein Aurels2KO_28220 [Aureliella sp.]
MTKPWEKRDTVRWVAAIIQSRGKDAGMPHDQITQQLLEGCASSVFITRLSRETKKSREWIADNMVAYFSKELANDSDNLASRFRRFRFGGKWAYRYEGRD